MKIEKKFEEKDLTVSVEGRIDTITSQELENSLNDEIENITSLTLDFSSLEYISSLWRKKIPKMLAEAAKKQWLYWYYTFGARSPWKTCSRCGETKPAHNMFFSKNSASKDGFYSICKECRNSKKAVTGKYARTKS